MPGVGIDYWMVVTGEGPGITEDFISASTALGK